MKKRTRVYFIPSHALPLISISSYATFPFARYIFTTKENKVLIRLAGAFCSEIHNQLPSAMLLTDIFSYLLQNMRLFCCNLSGVFATFSFFFLSPASLSHFILFICKVSMTVNCLFKGGVEEAF